MILGGGPSLPPEKIRVTLARGPITLQQTTADADGKFAFTQLTEGDYSVKIEAPGYRTYEHLAALRFPGHEEESFSVRLVPLDSGSTTGRTGGQISPKAAEWFRRGLNSSRAGKHEKAAKFYSEAVLLSPGYAEAWVNLGGEYRLLKRWANAEEALLRALALDPEAALAYLQLGMLFLAEGKLPEARESLEEAQEKDPQLAAAHFLVGWIAYEKMEMDVAAREFRRALELDPQTTPEAKLYLASIWAAQGKFPEAKRELEDFLKGNPTHPKAAEAKRLLEKIRNF